MFPQIIRKPGNAVKSYQPLLFHQYKRHQVSQHLIAPFNPTVNHFKRSDNVALFYRSFKNLILYQKVK
jgi:hypothetical protein